MPTERPSTSFKFRGGSFHALVLNPETPLSTWLADVDALLARSPGFFAKKSVVIDVSDLSLKKQNFLDLLDELSSREIRVLGVLQPILRLLGVMNRTEAIVALHRLRFSLDTDPTDAA